METENGSMEEAGSGNFTVDLTGVDENSGGFEAMPRGMYDCLIDDCQFGPSKNSGNPMWTWVLEVESGDYAGRKLFFHLPFTENMLPRIKKILNRIVPSLAATAFDPAKVAAEGTLVGVRCKVRVDTRPYEGQIRNNVRDILPPSAEGEGTFM